MKRTTLFKITGITAIAQAVLMAVCFGLLAQTFGYPEIIREAPGVILTELFQGIHVVPYLYQGVAYSGLLLIFEAILFKKSFENETNEVWLDLGQISGVLSGFVFLMGLMRWAVLIPWLAQLYATRQADPKVLELLFEAFNTYIGFSVAEHLGFLFLSLMGLFWGVTILRTNLIPAWVGWLGLLLGVWVIYGNTEIFHFPFAFLANRVGAELLGGWNIIIGVYLILKKGPKEHVEKRGTSLAFQAE
jgi:hypothetical protein